MRVVEASKDKKCFFASFIYLLLLVEFIELKKMSFNQDSLVGLGIFGLVVSGVTFFFKLKKQGKLQCCGWKCCNSNKTKSICCGGKSEASCEVDSKQTDAFNNISDLNLPVIYLNLFFNKNGDPKRYQDECVKLANSLHEYGAAIIRDPRFREEENIQFLNMLEQYFEMSDGRRDARPEIGYQVGVTPEKVEVARDHAAFMDTLSEENQPISPRKSRPDNKWRFFWRMNKQPAHTKFPQHYSDNVVPPEFPQWSDVMNNWGGRMMDAQRSIAEMLAIGFNFPPDTFLKLIQNGPHLLAPTGSDLGKYGNKNDVLAGFHTDLNYITIHGKSRFPGLFIWTRDGQKKAVKVPDGCLLIQAGKQLEYLTGGYVLAGFHEVIVTDATLKAIETKKARGESLWRVSSTLFCHIGSDEILEPLYSFKNETSSKKFPPIYAGDQVKKELETIKLLK